MTIVLIIILIETHKCIACWLSDPPPPTKRDYKVLLIIIFVARNFIIEQILSLTELPDGTGCWYRWLCFYE